jgi:dihydrofolate synthase / folylpolyglutamate synthase
MDAADFLAQLETKRRISSREEKLHVFSELTRRTGLTSFPIPMILLAGTCGKGSTAYFLSSILEANGYKVGMITSPHLTSYTERVQINRTPVKKEQILAKVQQLFPVFQQIMESDQASALNYNQVFLTIGLHLFLEEKANFILIESGIGGYNDPCSIFTPLLSIITNIHRDHEAILGHTYEEIAYDKSGIIKEHTPVITGTQIDSARSIIQQEAAKKKAPLSCLGMDFSACGHGSEIIYQENDFQFSYTLQVAGQFQWQNSALAIRASRTLQQQGFTLTMGNMRKGLAQAYIPGRFQIIMHSPLLVIDGAHNEEEISQFCKTVKDLSCQTNFIIAGFSSDKQISNMLMEFSGLNCIFLFVPHSNVGRAKHPEDLVQIGSSLGFTSYSFAELRQALEYAKSKAKKDDGIFITGSMFLAGDALHAIKKHRLFSF